MRHVSRISSWLVCGCVLGYVGLGAAEFSIRTVDGLNRPLVGVQITVSCAERTAGDGSYVLISGSDGIARGTYDETTCTPRSVGVEKQGYTSFFTGFRNQYELRRQISAEEIGRVTGIGGEAALSELRELLAGDARGLDDPVFLHEKQLRSALRALAREPEVTLRARWLLALIGEPEDIRYILRLPPPPPEPFAPDRWRYGVAAAMVQPEDDEEWAFLQRCAWGQFFDGWVDWGAIVSLKLNGSARSREILVAARGTNSRRANTLERALAYIDTNPPPLADADLETLARRVAEALAIGTWEGNGMPRLNREGDKALVTLKFQAGSDYLEYTATFHRAESVWRLKGIRETLQAFAPRITVKRATKTVQ